MPSDGYFDENVAATYDNDIGSSDSEAVEPVVDFLAELVGGGRALEFGIGTVGAVFCRGQSEVSGGGRALEFGIGTGRIALPLARRGIEVHGIDCSQAMLTKLAEKPGGNCIPVRQGDFATTSCEGSFSLVYLIFNTIMNLTTQDEQVQCFQNAASHLDPGGSFVIEVMVPALQLLPFGETHRVFQFQEDHWGIDTYDVVSQGLVSHHFRVRGQKPEHSAIPFRYVWPSELDLMAKIANLRLKARWGSWQKEPFTNLSRFHVSVWQKSDDEHWGDR